MIGRNVQIRRASADDAPGMTCVLQAVAAERVYSAIDHPWSADQERSYLLALSNREATHVAMDPSGEMVGYQSLDLYSPYLSSMAHVAKLGTYLLPAWRGRGIGRALFQETTRFARASGYRKFVILVRASNTGAQAFYRRLGFSDCGRLTRQVIIDGREDDEMVMELFL